MPLALFVFLAVLTVISSFGVILQRNPIHCLLALVVALLAIGVLFIALDAVTVGFLQIIVYVGAIMVLFLFVIWLLNLQAQPLPFGSLGLKFLATIAAAALVAELLGFVFRIHPTLAPTPVVVGYGAIDLLAATLFGNYLIAFEITSILLLVAVIGAVAMARHGGHAPSDRGGSAGSPPGVRQ